MGNANDLDRGRADSGGDEPDEVPQEKLLVKTESACSRCCPWLTPLRHSPIRITGLPGKIRDSTAPLSSDSNNDGTGGRPKKAAAVLSLLPPLLKFLPLISPAPLMVANLALLPRPLAGKDSLRTRLYESLLLPIIRFSLPPPLPILVLEDGIASIDDAVIVFLTPPRLLEPILPIADGSFLGVGIGLPRTAAAPAHPPYSGVDGVVDPPADKSTPGDIVSNCND